MFLDCHLYSFGDPIINSTNPATDNLIRVMDLGVMDRVVGRCIKPRELLPFWQSALQWDRHN